MRGDFVAESILSSRGQITLPKELRDALFLKQGDKVEFRVRSGEVTLSARRAEADDPVGRWVGALPAELGPGGGKAWVRELRGYEDEVTG
jgi:AbrB family looped-hinge helix DNA binding protein